MPSNTHTLQIALIQHPPVFLNLPASVERAGSLTRKAGEKGARVVVFPETWLPGYPVWLDEAPEAALWDHPPAKALFQVLFDNALVLDGPQFQHLQTLAQEVGVDLVMGAHERRGGTLYNTMLFFSRDGQTTCVHRKLVPTYTERMVWGRGDGSTLRTLQTDFGPLGGLVCWEHWMPAARAAMHAQHEVLHVAQWPTVKALHHLCSRHYAFEGQCFVAAVGTVLSKGDMLAGFDSLGLGGHPGRHLLASMPGDDDTLMQRGGSAVIAPNTDYLAGPLYDEASALHATLDLRLIAEGRLALDTDGHYARPDVFQLQVNDQPQSNVRFGAR